jgi:hypothetical protein
VGQGSEAEDNRSSPGERLLTGLGSTGLAEDYDGPLSTPGSADESHLPTRTSVENRCLSTPWTMMGNIPSSMPLSTMENTPLTRTIPRSMTENTYSLDNHLIDELSEEDLSVEPLVHEGE